MTDCVYVNPDFIARDQFSDWNSLDSVLKTAKKALKYVKNTCVKARNLAFETVLSAPDKVDFIRCAKKSGYFVRLFFVGTDDPSINAKRRLPCR